MTALTPIENQLIEKEIINEERIREIRNWIEAHYKTADGKEKAAIFARKIHSMIDDFLPNLPKEAKKEIRIELIKKNLNGQSLIINANDVFRACVSEDKVQEWKEEMSSWLKKTVINEDGIEERDIELFLHNVIDREKESVETGNPDIFEIADSINQVDDSGIDTVEQPIEQPVERKWLKGKFSPMNLAVACSIVGLAVFGSMNFLGMEKDTEAEMEQTAEAAEISGQVQNELPSYLQYTSINQEKLRKYLKKRNSLLADEPYFSTIIKTASKFNIHPLLLFAITGQEQGFVPKDNEKAKKIANNPYNVFHSWKEYNTNIQDSTEIAARTVVNLSKDRPEDADPFQWINRKYAEDKKWWKGVKKIFEHLQKEVE